MSQDLVDSTNDEITFAAPNTVRVSVIPDEAIVDLVVRPPDYAIDTLFGNGDIERLD